MDQDRGISSSQKKAADEIRVLLEKPNISKSPPLIAILGLSGVGKDTLWSTIEPEFNNVEFSDVYSLYKFKEPETHKKYVTTLIPSEAPNLEWSGDVNLVVVKGMTESEIRNHITKKTSNDNNIEEIVQKSVGIPLLADRILSRNLSDQEIDLLVGTHLSICWDYRENKSILNKYVQFEPPTNIMDIFLNSIEGYDVFHDISLILSKYEKFTESGIEVVSPFFKAKNSYEIYRQRNMRMYGESPRIFAPAISYENYLKIRKEFLPHGETNNYECNLEDTGSRLDMFNSWWNKIEMYLESDFSDSEVIDVRYYYDKPVKNTLDGWKEHLKELDLPDRYFRHKTGNFFLFAREHDGRSNLKISWATESLLQNLNIPYVVGYWDETYLYDPVKQLMINVQDK